jgi:hypothetical protein
VGEENVNPVTAAPAVGYIPRSPPLTTVEPVLVTAEPPRTAKHATKSVGALTAKLVGAALRATKGGLGGTRPKSDETYLFGFCAIYQAAWTVSSAVVSLGGVA